MSEQFTESDREYAIMQGASTAASESYFKARPQLEGRHNERIFEAGFERGYKYQESEIAALRSQLAELQRKLSTYEEAAKQEAVGHFIDDAILGMPVKTFPLYRLPPNLPALIEQAIKKEREANAILCEDLLNTQSDGSVLRGIGSLRISSVYANAIRARNK